ncbi:MAG: hypothetical protein WCA12_07840 [Burkholderiales bacterium]
MIDRGEYFILAATGPERDATAFRADVGQGALIGLNGPAAPQGTTTPDAEEQRELAERVDARVRELGRAGVHDIELFVGMAEQMPLFKRLLDIAGPERVSALCDEYPGLYRYAQLLETIASGIESGDIELPQ